MKKTITFERQASKVATENYKGADVDGVGCKWEIVEVSRSYQIIIWRDEKIAEVASL